MPPPPSAKAAAGWVLIYANILLLHKVPCFEGCWHVVLDFVFLLVGKL